MRGRLEQFLQLLAPQLLLLLELLQLPLTILLQQLLELGTSWRMPFLSFFLLQLLPLLRLPPRLLLALLLLLLPLLLDGAKPGRPGHPLCGERDLGLLVHRTSVLQEPVATRTITYSDRIPSTPDRRGSGAPSCPWWGGASTCFGDDGADSPTKVRGGAFSAPVSDRGSEEPVKHTKAKVSRHDDRRKYNTSPITTGISR